jgi:sugar-specific transcriptional regulator TrmB
MQKLGFSRYEAQAYVALLRKNPMNGYELAKASGIPRPNIYPVLRKLEEAGAVLRLETPGGARYEPVAAEELLSTMKHRYQHSIDEAAEGLRELVCPAEGESVLNLRGYAPLIEQARALIERSKDQLLLSIWPQEAVLLRETIAQAQARGVRITTLCLRGCPQPCPACQGDVFRYAIAPGQDARWLVLVADESELLAGEIPSGGEDETSTGAVRTRQPMLVNLTGSYIQNSIALASILSGLGSQVEQGLDARSLAAINRLRPLHGEGPWLEHLRQRLHIAE